MIVRTKVDFTGKALTTQWGKSGRCVRISARQNRGVLGWIAAAGLALGVGVAGAGAGTPALSDATRAEAGLGASWSGVLALGDATEPTWRDFMFDMIWDLHWYYGGDPFQDLNPGATVEIWFATLEAQFHGTGQRLPGIMSEEDPGEGDPANEMLEIVWSLRALTLENQSEIDPGAVSSFLDTLDDMEVDLGG